MKSLLTFACLYGAATAAQFKNRAQSTIGSLAETLVGTSHSCSFSIDRINAGPADYKSIIAAGTPYTDSSFGPDAEMVRWSDRPGSSSLSTYS